MILIVVTVTKDKEEKEIDFSVDPKEQYLEDILKLMNQQNLMPDGVALNQPVLSSEVFFTISRMPMVNWTIVALDQGNLAVRRAAGAPAAARFPA